MIFRVVVDVVAVVVVVAIVIECNNVNSSKDVIFITIDEFDCILCVFLLFCGLSEGNTKLMQMMSRILFLFTLLSD